MKEGKICGDVNLFLNVDSERQGYAEVDVMIAEKESRRKGLAGEAVNYMMAYGFKHHNCKGFIAKILK